MKLHSKNSQMVVAALAVLTGIAATVAPAQAGLITIAAESHGSFSDRGEDFGRQGISIVGSIGMDRAFRNYYSFNLSGLNIPTGQKVTGLQLSLWSFNYSSPDPSETFELYDYNIPNNGAPTIGGSPVPVNEPYAPGVAIYDDLGSGVKYGSYVAKPTFSFNDPYLITLNSNALTAFNLSRTSGGYFNIGGTLSTLSSTTQQEYLFGNVSNLFPGQNLIVTTSEVAPVPELGTMTLMLIAMMALMGGAWMRKKKEGETGSRLNPFGGVA